MNGRRFAREDQHSFFEVKARSNVVTMDVVVGAISVMGEV